MGRQSEKFCYCSYFLCNPGVRPNLSRPLLWGSLLLLLLLVNAPVRRTQERAVAAPPPLLFERTVTSWAAEPVLAMACIKIRLLWERNRPKTGTKRRDLGYNLFVSENCFFVTFHWQVPRFWAIGLKTFNFDGDFRTSVSQLQCSVENLHSLLKVMPPKMEKFYIFGYIKQSLFCIWRPYCFADGLSSLLNLINVKCKS
jgi:hypothetical protein